MTVVDTEQGPLRFPAMPMDFPHLRHPDMEQAEQHAREWWNEWIIPATRVGAVRPPCGYLAAYAFPWCNRDIVEIGADVAAWLWAVDDGHVDESEPDSVAAATQIAAMLRALDGEIADTPLAAALMDIHTRYRRHSTPAQLARFCEKVRSYLLGCLAETVHRARHHSPTVRDYLPLRLQASGCLPELAVVEIASGSPELPATQVHHPDVVALTNHAAYIIAMFNDVLSCLREIDRCPVDFIFNLPLVCAHASGSNLQTGLDRAAAITNARIHAFTELYERIEPAAEVALKTHFHGIRNWLQGFYDWQLDCGRYLPYWQAQATPPTR